MTDPKMPNKGNVKGVEGKGVDDLTNMNAFLAMIGGTPVPKTHFERPAAVVKSQLTVERAEPVSFPIFPPFLFISGDTI